MFFFSTFSPVAWILAIEAAWIMGTAFYQGLGAHFVLGALVQGAALASFYPFVEEFSFKFVSDRPALGEASFQKGAVVKLIADCWSLLRHTGKTLVICLVWNPSFDNFQTRWTNPPYTWGQTFVMVFYYTCICDWFCDYYLYTRTCRLAKIRPKDYSVMVAHHIITILLMGGSAALGYFAIGTAVVYLHEWTDIFISLVKIFRTTRSPYLVPLFTLNLFVWFGARVVWFIPYLILPAIRMASTPFMCFLTLALVVLWSMHIYWFGLMAWLAHSLTRTTSSEVTKMYDR
jgi:ceramide synthetase